MNPLAVGRGLRQSAALHWAAGVGGYTVRAAVEDWLEHGLSGRSVQTVQLHRDG